MEVYRIVKIALPYVTTCTPRAGVNGTYHTPLTCVQASDTEKVYKFATPNIPLDVVDDTYYARVTNIAEQGAKLKPDKGLASRPSASVSFADFNGDPNDINNTEASFFKKFLARNIFSNRVVTIEVWKYEGGVHTKLTSNRYLSESLQRTAEDKYTLRCKSYLSLTYDDSAQFPAPTGATLRADIDDVTGTIPVNGSEYAYQAGDVLRIGGEFMKVNSVSGSGASMTLAVSRGSPITGSSGTITTTEKESHDAGDDIQVCYVADGLSVADYLEDLLLFAGIPSSYINKTDWNAEIGDYWSGFSITNVLSEPKEVKKLIDELCGDLMLDVWEDTEAEKIKLSAVSVWKSSSLLLVDGQQITSETLQVKPKPEMRVSRAFVWYDKRNKALNDDRINFKQLSTITDTTLESSDFYGKPKRVELKPSEILTTIYADLRVQRQVARFSSEPLEFSFYCELPYKNFSLGDVVEIPSEDYTDADGLPLVTRAQITETKPIHEALGHKFKVAALSYVPALDSGAVFTLTGSTNEINLWQQAGAPIGSVDVTFVFDGLVASSGSASIPAIRAGSFGAGSSIKIICINGADLQSKGGEGGDGASAFWDIENLVYLASSQSTAGEAGGTVYNADGVDTDIYLSGSIDGYTADGYLRAAGGGGGGAGADISGTASGGSGGGGGAGRDVGAGGAGGSIVGGSSAGNNGAAGASGSTTGTGGAGGNLSPTGGAGGGWGQAGAAGSAGSAGGGNGSAGGAAGKGIVKGGAVVNLFGETASRFINGSGDTPNS